MSDYFLDDEDSDKRLDAEIARRKKFFASREGKAYVRSVIKEAGEFDEWAGCNRLGHFHKHSLGECYFCCYEPQAFVRVNV